jgi:hypothetical protein
MQKEEAASCCQTLADFQISLHPHACTPQQQILCSCKTHRIRARGWRRSCAACIFLHLKQGAGDHPLRMHNLGPHSPCMHSLGPSSWAYLHAYSTSPPPLCHFACTYVTYVRTYTLQGMLGSMQGGQPGTGFNYVPASEGLMQSMTSNNGTNTTTVGVDPSMAAHTTQAYDPATNTLTTTTVDPITGEVGWPALSSTPCRLLATAVGYRSRLQQNVAAWPTGVLARYRHGQVHSWPALGVTLAGSTCIWMFKGLFLGWCMEGSPTLLALQRDAAMMLAGGDLLEYRSAVQITLRPPVRRTVGSAAMCCVCMGFWPLYHLHHHQAPLHPDPPPLLPPPPSTPPPSPSYPPPPLQVPPPPP